MTLTKRKPAVAWEPEGPKAKPKVEWEKDDIDALVRELRKAIRGGDWKRAKTTTGELTVAESGGHVLTMHEGPPAGTFVVIGKLDKREDYGVKFNYNFVSEDVFYDMIGKLARLAKRLDIGMDVGLKSINITKDGRIVGVRGELAKGCIYPRFESGLSENQFIDRYVEFYKTAREMKIDVLLVLSEAEEPGQRVLRSELKRRGIGIVVDEEMKKQADSAWGQE